MSSSSTVSSAHPSHTLFFSGIPDDILVNILCRLGEDPRDLARLACVSTRFCKVIRSVCWKFRCEKNLPVLVAELLQGSSLALVPYAEPPGGWASLQKLLVCCPGLWHAGVLLESWDFGLDREIGWFDSCGTQEGFSSAGAAPQKPNDIYPLSKKGRSRQSTWNQLSLECTADRSASMEYTDVTSHVCGDTFELDEVGLGAHRHGHKEGNSGAGGHERVVPVKEITNPTPLYMGHPDNADLEDTPRHNTNKRQRESHYEHCHVANGPWNLSREQGNKLLANRFRADSLYICDWPGCVHPGEKRIYKLFRGVFKNFKGSHVWRNLRDMHAKATNVGCAFCVCKFTWDMVTTFCLKRSIEFHDDGEPVIRAYVCENGHVAGAWTDRPMYMP